jgi:hypothetical protein
VLPRRRGDLAGQNGVGDAEQIPPQVSPEAGGLRRRVALLCQRVAIRAGAVGLARAQQREPARIPPDPERVRGVRGLRLRELRPAPEASHHLVQEERAVRRLARQVARGLQRHRALPVVRGGEEEHVQVVRRVHRHPPAFACLHVGHARLLVAADRIAPTPDVHQNVRRHVRDMAHPRDRVLQQFRTGDRATGIARGLDRVDVQVAGAGVRDVALEDALQRGHRDPATDNTAADQPALRALMRGSVHPRA